MKPHEWGTRRAGSDGIHPTLRDNAAKDGAPGFFAFSFLGVFAALEILQRMLRFFGFASE
jgi:hypothetical protein